MNRQEEQRKQVTKADMRRAIELSQKQDNESKMPLTATVSLQHGTIEFNNGRTACLPNAPYETLDELLEDWDNAGGKVHIWWRMRMMEIDPEYGLPQGEFDAELEDAT